jgi:hypothetical protein
MDIEAQVQERRFISSTQVLLRTMILAHVSPRADSLPLAMVVGQWTVTDTERMLQEQLRELIMELQRMRKLSQFAFWDVMEVEHIHK